MGSEGTKVFDLAEAGIAGAERLYFRVEKQPNGIKQVGGRHRRFEVERTLTSGGRQLR